MLVKGSFALLLGVLSGSSVFSQQNLLDQKITIQFDNQAVDDALKKLMREADCIINFNFSDLPQGRRVTRTFRETDMRTIIKEVWGTENLSFLATENRITIQVVPKKEIRKEKGTLTGRITDDKEVVLPGATVRLIGTPYGAVSGAEGQFEIKEIRSGQYPLEVSTIGFEKINRTVTISANSVLKIDFTLSESANELDEIIVMGKTEAQEISEEPITVTALDAKPVQEQSLGAEELLKVSTGVVVRQSGGLGSPVNINLNGLQGNAIRIYYDGIPINVFGTGLQLNTIPVDALERIEVFKGVIPVDVGTDALGGGINIVPANQEYDNLNASYTFGSFNTHRVTLNATRNLSEKFSISTLSFFNYSDNDYTMRDIESVTERNINGSVITGADEVIDARRFHDRHSSGYFEAAFTLKDLKWADRLQYAPFFSFNDDEIQHGAFISNSAAGEATTSSRVFAHRLDYRKKLWNDKLSLRYFGLVSFSRNEVRDSTINRYNWRGEVLANPRGGAAAELFSQPILREGDDFGTAHRVIVKQKITENLTFTASNFYRYTRIQGEDQAIQANEPGEAAFDPNREPSSLTRNIFGAELTATLLGEKLTPVVFYKNYEYSAEAVDILTSAQLNRPFIREVRDNTPGYGLAIKYQLHPTVFIRSSYERTIRIPTEREIFGDFGPILPNFELRPEQSDNLNVGIQYSQFFSSGRQVSIKIDGFLRDQQDLIRPQPVGADNIRFINEAQVDGRGLEVATRFSPVKNLNLTTNFTTQSNEIGESANSGSEGRQVPNIPRLFFNAGARYTFEEVFKTANELEVFWTYFFIDRFSRNEVDDIGRANPDEVIPSQHVQNTGLIYRMKDQGLSLSFNLNNVLNAEVFDNFRIPRPGINYQIKINYSLK